MANGAISESATRVNAPAHKFTPVNDFSRLAALSHNFNESQPPRALTRREAVPKTSPQRVEGALQEPRRAYEYF
jgi:hypothetical protein